MWSQNADPDANGFVDAYFTADCGEECCSIVQFALGRGYTHEADVRLAMPGHRDHGQTTGPDLAAYLQSVGLKAQYIGSGYSETREAVKHHIDRSRPCILLGYWLSKSILHWVVVIGHGNGHMLYIDPWDAQLKAIPWSRAGALYAGGYVVVDRRMLSIVR